MSVEDAVKLVSGGIAGCISRTSVAPLERLKILLQVQHVTGHAADAKYGSFWKSFGTIYREEGVRGLYKGNMANCVRVFPYIGTQFLCFDRYKGAVLGATGKTTLGPLEKLCVGALSGMTSVLVTYPLDFMRGRLSAQGGAVATQYDGMFHLLKSVVRQEGFLALYQGIPATLIGIAPYVGVNYLVYEQLKEKLPIDDPANGHLYRLACGGVAGTSGATVAYPLDLLRRRFQLQSIPGNKLSPEKRYKSVPHAVRMILREEGVLGLYKGFLPNFIKVVPTIAIMFTVNDALKGMWSERATERSQQQEHRR